MGGRTNDASDWLNGVSQDDFDSNATNAMKHLTTLRKSGYKTGVDEKTGEEYDLEKQFRKEGESDADFQTRMEENARTTRDYYARKGIGDSTYAPAEAKTLERPPPKAPDLTDDAIKKARQAAYWRTQMGKNAKSSFATQGTLGGFDVNKPVLGGY
jgi:hypothetical protein